MSSKEYIHAAERRSEKIRRDHVRSRYLAEGTKDVVKYRRLTNEAVGRDRDTFDGATDKWFGAAKVFHELMDNAFLLWPSDLDKSCPGDAGPLGELCLAEYRRVLREDD